jgi:hypothetical protein
VGSNQAFIKDPDAVLDYQVDWSSWLATGDTIAASVWVVQIGITKVTDTHTTTTATIWLSGGTVGTSYTAANKVTTVGGRTDERTLTISVEQR